MGEHTEWVDLIETDLAELTISDVGVAVEYIADNVLMMKIYHLAGLQNKARELIIGIGKLL